MCSRGLVRGVRVCVVFVVRVCRVRGSCVRGSCEVRVVFVVRVCRVRGSWCVCVCCVRVSCVLCLFFSVCKDCVSVVFRYVCGFCGVGSFLVLLELRVWEVVR